MNDDQHSRYYRSAMRRKRAASFPEPRSARSFSLEGPQAADATNSSSADESCAVAILDPLRPSFEGLRLMLSRTAYRLVVAERYPAAFFSALDLFYLDEPQTLVVVVMELDLAGLRPEALDIIKYLVSSLPRTRTIVYTSIREYALLARAKAAGAAATLGRYQERPTIEGLIAFVAAGGSYYVQDTYATPSTPVTCPLAPAEFEQVVFYAMGFDQTTIAQILGLSRDTVRSRAGDIHNKLDKRSAGAAWHFCHRSGWLTADHVRDVARRWNILPQNIPVDYLNAFLQTDDEL